MIHIKNNILLHREKRKDRIIAMQSFQYQKQERGILSQSSQGE